MQLFIAIILAAAAFQSMARMALLPRKWTLLLAVLVAAVPPLSQQHLTELSMADMKAAFESVEYLQNRCVLVVIQELLAILSGFSLLEAHMDGTRSAPWKYVAFLPSALQSFAAVFENSFGWETMKPDAIKDHLWDKYKEVCVDDSLKLGVPQAFESKNPYAMQQMTAVMLEAIRKGMWSADEATAKQLAEYHAKLVDEHGAGCSNFVCDNQKLKDMIAKLQSDPQKAERYLESIRKIREIPMKQQTQEEVKGQVLKEEKIIDKPESVVRNRLGMIILGAVILCAVGLFFFGSRKKMA